MKKLMLISAALMLAATTFAGDVCAIRLSVKEPVIKQGKSYYKDFKTNTYKGWINFEYEEDGTMPATCAAVIYGNFNGVREAREYDVGIATCNSYGKNGDKIEISMLLEDESFGMILTGTGKCKRSRSRPTDACGVGVDCTNTLTPAYASGVSSGIIHDVVCDPCDGLSYAWWFNVCLDAYREEATEDITYGRWGMRLSRSLSFSCGNVGFPECILGKIPRSYIVQ